MSKSLLFVLFAFSFSALADLQVTPVVPVNCQKVKKPTNVTMMSAVPSIADGDRTTFKLVMSFVNCQNGQYKPNKIADDFNFYILNQEYSRDFQSDYARAGNDNSAIAINMSMIPDEFFALTPDRHFNISFYPSANSVSYGWNLVFSRNPQTKQITVNAEAL